MDRSYNEITLLLHIVNKYHDQTKCLIVSKEVLNSEKEFNSKNIKEIFKNTIANMDLKKILRENSIIKFVPFDIPTFDINDHILQFTIYHDEIIHNIIYKNKNVEYNPSGEIKYQLKKLYNMYGFDYFSPIWYG
jgi:hypothetical protein